MNKSIFDINFLPTGNYSWSYKIFRTGEYSDNYDIRDENSFKWELRTLGDGKSEIINSNFRNSYKISEIYNQYAKSFRNVNKELYLVIKDEKYYNTVELNNEFNKFIIDTYGENFKNEGLDNFFFKDENQENFYRKWKVHKYMNDGFFVKHSDTKINENHIGTMVLLPPKLYSEYEGGELILYDINDSAKIEEKVVPNIDTWKLVFIKIGQQHEISKVTKGIRYSFTSPYFINFTTQTLKSSKKYNTKLSSEKINQVLLKDAQSKIDTYNSKIKKLEEMKMKLLERIEMNDLEELDILSDVKNFVKNIPSYHSIIICKNFYVSPEPNNLKMSDSILFNEILEEYPSTNIQFVNMKLRIPAGNSFDEIEDDEWGCESQNYSIMLDYEIAHKFNKDIINDVELRSLLSNARTYSVFDDYYCYYNSDELPGQLEYNRSEYNDEYYENSKDIIVTVMILNKDE